MIINLLLKHFKVREGCRLLAGKFSTYHYSPLRLPGSGWCATFLPVLDIYATIYPWLLWVLCDSIFTILFIGLYFYISCGSNYDVGELFIWTVLIPAPVQFGSVPQLMLSSSSWVAFCLGFYVLFLFHKFGIWILYSFVYAVVAFVWIFVYKPVILPYISSYSFGSGPFIYFF